MAKDYYANEQGFQLEEFLIELSQAQLKTNQYNFTSPQGFFILNALKYKVRAGKKEGNTLGSDLQKIEDYITLAEKTGFKRYEVELELEMLHGAFLEWNGEPIEWL